MLQNMVTPVQGSGSGRTSAYAIYIKHMSNNNGNINSYYDIMNDFMSNDYINTHYVLTTNEAVHTPSGTGGVFDFTITFSTDLSARFYHSGSYGETTVNMDIIRNGVSNSYVVDMGTRLDMQWILRVFIPT